MQQKHENYNDEDRWGAEEEEKAKPKHKPQLLIKEIVPEVTTVSSELKH